MCVLTDIKERALLEEQIKGQKLDNELKEIQIQIAKRLLAKSL